MPFEEREQEIADRKQNPGLLRRVLPDFFAELLLEDLEEWEASIYARREDVLDSYEEFISDAEAAITEAESTWDRMESEEIPVSEIASLRDRLADLSERDPSGDHVPEFEYDPETYLRRSELTQLTDYSQTADSLQAKFAAKIAFERNIDRIADIADRMPFDTETIRRRKTYLTRSEFARIRTEVPNYRTALNPIFDIETGQLPPQDYRRLNSHRGRYQEYHSVVTGDSPRETYNDEFVEAERARYSHLVTGLTEENVALTDEQAAAVFSNAKYNQIIAGAGTGKTLALTTRIAYLVEKGVDPDDIVALTFTGKAAETMERRLRALFDISEVDVRTINSFGRSVIQSFGSLPSDTISGPKNFVEDFVKNGFAGLPDSFRKHYAQYRSAKTTDYIDESEFESEDELIEERTNRNYETLKGEAVKSIDEKIIADYLFENAIPYRYEAEADWADTGQGNQVYEPDFYLPDHDIYIEHWGIDERARVPAFFEADEESSVGADPEGEAAHRLDWDGVDPASLEYCETILLKRADFGDTDRTLINTYHFEKQANRLREALESRLRIQGVEPQPMPPEQFREKILEASEKHQLIEDFSEFIQTARRYDRSARQIRSRLTPDEPVQNHFGHCGAILTERYREYLRAEDRIDFLGQILWAIPLVEETSDIAAAYEHVLVDEFQDISLPQARLFAAMTDGERSPTLFAVGDDWQSIYGFRGGNPQYFINFADQFGPPDRVKLTRNFRSRPPIVRTGNEIIRHNEAQIEKDVRASREGGEPPTLHVLGGGDETYVGVTGSRAGALAYDWLITGEDGGIGDPSEVKILCRYDQGSDHIAETKKHLRRLNIPYQGYSESGNEDVYLPRNGLFSDVGKEDALSIYSMHRSKGEEAKCVILLHVATSGQAFPKDEPGTDLLAPVRDNSIETVAEERRLFYVGATRPEETLHVLTREGHRSPFVDEIEGQLQTRLSVVALRDRSQAFSQDQTARVTINARVKTLYDDIHEKKDQAGVLDDDTGAIRFVTWKHEGAPELEEGETYTFRHAKLDRFRGQPQLAIDKRTAVSGVQFGPGILRNIE